MELRLICPYCGSNEFEKYVVNKTLNMLCSQCGEIFGNRDELELQFIEED